ncbi:Zinc finger protein [Schistosoma japonicum]|uniref:Zinc finger protein n=1 Tax=Schistosoma japonicum TaxID=6182 RepID=A0A4Z2DWX8_SCHJA|nr:Zinc finger protein [Schistosoma japonicum]
MSSVATSGLICQASSLIPSQVMRNNVESANETIIQKGHKKSQEYESDTESDTTSNDDDTSDDDKRLADNPILKERLKQLDRYATPIKHHTHSPVQINDQRALLSLYPTGMSISDPIQHNGSVSIHGMPGESCEVIDSSSTPPEYCSRQLSAVESPSCSGPASLNASVTPKINLSPSYANISISGPIHHHETDISDTYSHLSTTLPTKSCELLPACKYSSSFNSSDVIHPYDIYLEDTEDNQDCVCKVCHIAYANQSSLRSHMKKHINHSIKRHQCDKCPYSTQYGKNLFKHIESMHTVDGSQELRCEGCCQCFSSEVLLRDHDCLLTQCNTYCCNECGRAFKTKLRLKYHADVHNPRKPYVCDIDGCDRAFRTPKYLKNHRDEFHRMHPKNYMCPVEQCDFVFHRKTHLKRHIATHDDAEKKYQCQWPNCHRQFCSEETLNLHHRKHTGEKPFSCALCLYKCYDKSNLNEHYQVHHAKDANIDCSFKNIHHQAPSSCSSQRPQETLVYKGPFTDRTLVTRTSTPVPTLRHRMADILGSCNSQVPGPFDAEIDGILNSLDEESDLPDLFSNRGFKMDHPIIERKFVSNPSHNLNRLVSPCCQNNQSSCLTTFTPVSSFSSITTESETTESSVSSLLPNIISELQRAELSGSSEEFEKVKSHVLSLLPRFVMGEKLTVQINEIVDEVSDALVGQPLSVIQAAFHTAHPFTREESYMIGSLEQQLLSKSSLIAPNPPRRRGRRPKLQQQLQPYLQRIFGLESGAAESMASQLVNDSKKEKRTNYYGYYRSPVFRRGRISRGRGRSSKHSQSETPYDELFPRTSNFNHSQYDPSVVSICTDNIAGKRLGSGTNERYHIERMSDDMHTNFSGEINSHRNLTEQHNAHTEIIDSLKRANGFHAIYSQVHSEDFGHATKRFHCSPEINYFGMATKSQSSDGESNENTKNNISTSRYTQHQNLSASTQKNNSVRGYMTKESMFKSERNTRLHDPYSEKEFLNQEMLGEMLEDLGVIVQRIGERTVAKNHQNYLDSQPLNLSDFVHSGQVSGSADSQPILSRSETNPQSIQLPSMAALAPGSVGTPPSAEESTPGRVSNAEPQVLSPYPSSVSLRAPSSLKPSHPYNQSSTPMPDTDNLISDKLSTIISNASDKSEQITYDSVSNNYHRVAPMWSCESMCCPRTRNDEINKAEKSCPDNDYSSQVSQTRISESTKNYSKEINGVMSQCFYPKDLSTRMLSFGDRPDSSHQSSSSPKAFTRPGPIDSEFTGMRSESLGSCPSRLSSKAPAMGSFISPAEAVDHLRSLSALGAKYTASVGVSKVGQYQPYHHSRPGNYSHNNVQVYSDGLPHSEFATSHRPHNSMLIPTPNTFCANIPSLNTFFNHKRRFLDHPKMFAILQFVSDSFFFSL